MQRKNETDPLLLSPDDNSPSILPFPEISSQSHPRRRFSRLGHYIIPPSDINVHKVEIAAVKKRDMRDFLRYRLRSLYPANSDLTAFDYLLPESDGERDALLCICRSDVLNQHREAAKGKQIGVPLSLLMPVIGSYREVKLAFLYFGKTAIEIDLFDKNHLVSSTVHNRAQEGQEDHSMVDGICVEFGVEAAYCVIERPDDTAAFKICEGLRQGVQNIKIASLESAYKDLPRRNQLFQLHHRKNAVGMRVATAALIAIALLLGVFVVNKAVQRERHYAAYLDGELTSAQERVEYTLRLKDEVTALRTQVADLSKKPFVQPYHLLSDLRGILGTQAQIDTFFVEGNYFQIEAVSSDPLALMQRFTQHPYFSNLRIAEVVQDSGTDRKRFTLMGDYDDK